MEKRNKLRAELLNHSRHSRITVPEEELLLLPVTHLFEMPDSLLSFAPRLLDRDLGSIGLVRPKVVSTRLDGTRYS